MYNSASKNGAQQCELGTFSTFCAPFGGLESSNVTNVSRECATPVFPYRLQNLAYVSPRRSLCWKVRLSHYGASVIDDCTVMLCEVLTVPC